VNKKRKRINIIHHLLKINPPFKFQAALSSELLHSVSWLLSSTFSIKEKFKPIIKIKKDSSFLDSNSPQVFGNFAFLGTLKHDWTGRTLLTHFGLLRFLSIKMTKFPL
jgi:hypothetical protein